MLSPSEPTQVVRMLGAYQTSVRHTTSGSTLPGLPQGNLPSMKRSLSTRLVFDDTCAEDEEESRVPSKITRLGSDPFSSSLGTKRFPSANSGALSQIQEENESLKGQLKAMKVELAGAVAATAAMENKFAKAELELKKEQIEREKEKGKLKRELRDKKDKVEILENKLKRMVEKDKELHEEGSRNRKNSLDKTHDLDLKVRKLREEKIDLEEELTKLKMELGKKPDITQYDWQVQVQEFNNRISILEEEKEMITFQKNKAEEKNESALKATNELVSVKEELTRSNLKIKELESELRANADAVMQRQVMKDKLEKFSEMEKDNVSLRNRNELLVETAANSALLKEQVSQQLGELKRMEGRVRELDRVTAELEVAQRDLKAWGELVADWLSPQERESLGGKDIGLLMARDVVRKWQEREVQYVDTVSSLQNAAKESAARIVEKDERVGVLEVEAEKVKAEQEEQTKLLKRLQRKLLLVTKERDSYKGVLDSYEKEITLSGQEMDKAKVASLEKTIEEYRAMVEMLEEKGTKVNPNFEEQIKMLEEKNVSLELQLEQRAIKGDFNPTDTKVLHFINNPMSQAVEKRKLEVDELTQERDALKARVHLLEEGQTTDLTMMVGKKMDDGESSQEVTQMKEQLRKAELRKQRLMEAFKKTSHSFREVVYELTGYRIDVLADQKYRLTPIYAENSGDNLLFQKASSGEVQMLETEYSLELGDLMELHLEKHNSIPMFLAGLIRQLWRRHHSSDGDEEVERALESDSGSQDSLVEGKRSKESNAAGEVICIDDD